MSSGATITTDYLDGFQYRNAPQSGVGVLQFFPTAEGYVKNTVVNNVNTFDYVYNYTDHLGNIRVSYGIDPATQVLTIYEENNYYAFGLKHVGYDNTLKSIVNLKDLVYIHNANDIIPVDTKAARQQAVNPGEINNTLAQNSGYQYKYNGKEYQDELGLNVTAMDYRQYESAIGRFNTIDALAEKDHDKSPYAFARNNPVVFGDPRGLEAENNYNDGDDHDWNSGLVLDRSGEATINNSDFDAAHCMDGHLHEVVIQGKDFDREHGSRDDRAGVDQSDGIDLLEVMDVSSDWIKYAGIGTVIIGVVTLQPEIVVMGAEIFEEGDALGKLNTAVGIISEINDGLNGNNDSFDDAAIDAGFMLLDYGVGKSIDQANDIDELTDFGTKVFYDYYDDHLKDRFK